MAEDHRRSQLLPAQRWPAQTPTYRDAAPAVIEAALHASQRRPSGNWYAFAASDAIGDRPVRRLGRRASRSSPGAASDGDAARRTRRCPHLGADLSTGTVDCGTLICPWHGLRLDAAAAHSAGSRIPRTTTACWPGFASTTSAARHRPMTPVLPTRPDGAQMHAVTRLVGTCEPRDIIANRLDPWHGVVVPPVLVHPARGAQRARRPTTTCQTKSDRFLVAVTFRIGRLGVPVIAEFTSPEPRTIVMRIVDGEGTGSVVETHATPLGPGPDGLPAHRRAGGRHRPFGPARASPMRCAARR